ncbi:TetR/AcrR family transcriptional regulator [Nitrospira sp. Nam80]
MKRDTSHIHGRSKNRSATQRLIAAARRHFFLHGFRTVTMDDLAHELGMSKKTLYGCFPGKSALLEAVLVDKFREVDADLQRVASDRSNMSEVLHDLLACVQRHTGEIQPAFVRDIRREAPELFALIETRRSRLIRRYFGRCFDDARKAGLIREDIPAALITELLLAGVQAILNPAKMADLGLTPKTGFSAIIAVILQGVLTGTGRSRL